MFGFILRAQPVVALTALALTAPAAARAAPAVYGGSTRAGDAIVVDGNPSSTKLRSVVIAWEATCDSGMTLSDSNVLRAVPFSASLDSDVLGMTRNRKGRFAGKQLDAGTLDDGSSVVATVTVRGKLSRRRASGTLAADVTIRDAAGAQKDACHMAPTRWRAARAAGRIYAGSTSQREPLVVKLNRARSRATDVLIDWQSASCTPPGEFVALGEHFHRFPLDGSGAFGDSFTQTYPIEDGGEEDYAYQLHGRIGRKRAHGTFHATAASKDASGATTASCDSAPVTWSAVTG